MDELILEIGKVEEVSQINVFKCSRCGTITISANHDLALYEDPVITPPEGWGYSDEESSQLLCQNCYLEA